VAGMMRGSWGVVAEAGDAASYPTVLRTVLQQETCTPNVNNATMEKPWYS
jgi:hypothetical protein